MTGSRLAYELAGSEAPEALDPYAKAPGAILELEGDGPLSAIPSQQRIVERPGAAGFRRGGQRARARDPRDPYEWTPATGTPDGYVVLRCEYRPQPVCDQTQYSILPSAVVLVHRGVPTFVMVAAVRLRGEASEASDVEVFE